MIPKKKRKNESNETQLQYFLYCRYVHQGQVMERLLAVVPCHDNTGKGFHDMTSSMIYLLQKNYLVVGFCIADSTDGAANMQGKYNGFTTKMQDINQNHIHIW